MISGLPVIGGSGCDRFSRAELGLVWSGSGDASLRSAFLVDNTVMVQLENFRLKVFRVVAEHQSFHKAAEYLFLTQPAVTSLPELVVPTPQLRQQTFHFLNL